ncbi:anti-sigma factor family protein [Streptacidiphilus griseoplanus]|uniref:anti-sigma factor family protein n=1 Tax=Peterkaempfera griseoplana TaxID=66896 RepID=UPI0006E2515A|nr:zf-HC2 domain-containing protein [Peterkaempfera griseoplana]
MTSSTSGIGPTNPPFDGSAPAAGAPYADGHPTVEDISDLVEELLDPEAATALRTHLADCAECTDSHDALLEIRSLLGRIEQPGIPADVASGIDAALAAEASRTTEAPCGDSAAPLRLAPGSDNSAPRDRTRPTGGPGAGGPGRTARRRRLVRTLVSAAALAAAVGFGGVLLHGLSSGGAGASAASKADTAAGRQDSSVIAPHSLKESGRQGAAAPDAAGSGTTYTVENLGPQIMQLVSDQIEPSAGPRSSAPFRAAGTPENGAATPQGAATPSLPGCVLEATGHDGDDPVATDIGTFEGDPVGVVVYLDGDSSDDLEVFLIDSTCELTAPSTPGTVKLHRRVSKH